MAQKVQIMLVDDLDGGAASETVQFGLDGASYEIDLSAENAQKLRDSLASFIGDARRVGNRRRSGRTRSTARTPGAISPAEIREWARSNGFNVPDRGRVSAEVRKAYEAAH